MLSRNLTTKLHTKASLLPDPFILTNRSAYFCVLYILMLSDLKISNKVTILNWTSSSYSPTNKSKIDTSRPNARFHTTNILAIVCDLRSGPQFFGENRVYRANIPPHNTFNNKKIPLPSHRQCLCKHIIYPKDNIWFAVPLEKNRLF